MQMPKNKKRMKAVTIFLSLVCLNQEAKQVKCCVVLRYLSRDIWSSAQNVPFQHHTADKSVKLFMEKSSGPEGRKAEFNLISFLNELIKMSILARKFLIM